MVCKPLMGHRKTLIKKLFLAQMKLFITPNLGGISSRNLFPPGTFFLQEFFPPEGPYGDQRSLPQNKEKERAASFTAIYPIKNLPPFS